MRTIRDVAWRCPISELFQGSQEEALSHGYRREPSLLADTCGQTTGIRVVPSQVRKCKSLRYSKGNSCNVLDGRNIVCKSWWNKMKVDVIMIVIVMEQDFADSALMLRANLTSDSP